MYSIVILTNSPSEHNAIEDASIAMAKETLSTHNQQTEIVDVRVYYILSTYLITITQ